MKQYLKQHLAIFIIALMLIVSMFIQYLRIAHLDIPFLVEVETQTFRVYLAAIIGICLIVLVFVFAPILLITEITYQFILPSNINIKVKDIEQKLKVKINYDIKKYKRTIILRC